MCIKGIRLNKSDLKNLWHRNYWIWWIDWYYFRVELNARGSVATVTAFRKDLQNNTDNSG